MSSRAESPWLDPAVAAYIAQRAARPDDLQLELIEETRVLTGEMSVMQISPDQGALLSLLVGLSGARYAVEVGTFTGYSALCIAQAMGPGSRLVCFDVSEEWTAVAQRYWERAGLADRIELRIGPAADQLRQLPLDQQIDLVFIDADKTGYASYYETLLPAVRSGGLILVDNTLWSGLVVGTPETDDHDTVALQRFNDAVARDQRVDSYLLPVSDGLTLIRKR